MLSQNCTWVIANQSGERKHEPDEAAVYRINRVQFEGIFEGCAEKNLRFSQLEFGISVFWYVTEIFLALLRCSRILSVFVTSPSNTIFLWKVSENPSFSVSVIRFLSWMWIHNLFWFVCLKFCFFKGVWNLDFLCLNHINDKLIKTQVVFWNQLECVLFIWTRALFHCQLQPINWQSQRSSNWTNECTLQVESWNTKETSNQTNINNTV